MVYPVTGPFEKTLSYKGVVGIGGAGPPPKNASSLDKVVRRRWYRQSKPYDMPLQFTFSERKLEKYVSTFPGWEVFNAIDRTPPSYPQFEGVYRKAYDRFKSNLGSQASLSVSIAERKQAVGMIANRATQLAAFAVLLRRGKFEQAADVLGVRTPKRLLKPRARRRAAKNFSNNYLEFHFGWSPLVADIGSAVDVMQNGIPPARVTGFGSDTVVDFWSQPHNNGSETAKVTVVQQVRISAMVRVTDPNLHLANQLGFTNPALVAWELVPYSFVIDWFVNVSDFLAGYSDFAGLELTKAYSTTHTRFLDEYNMNTWYANYGVLLRSATSSALYVTRQPGLPRPPSLGVRPFKGFSVRRGLAAISLLLQKL